MGTLEFGLYRWRRLTYTSQGTCKRISRTFCKLAGVLTEALSTILRRMPCRTPNKAGVLQPGILDFRVGVTAGKGPREIEMIAFHHVL